MLPSPGNSPPIRSRFVQRPTTPTNVTEIIRPCVEAPNNCQPPGEDPARIRPYVYVPDYHKSTVQDSLSYRLHLAKLRNSSIRPSKLRGTLKPSVQVTESFRSYFPALDKHQALDEDPDS
ncbi:hypothetical protein BV898_17292 [Hypsibius exemplaris]|uniref:Uncharacterized protein n=1 Tax=Hypsibius exemplaris TaxID=2072580 RepID=A0A9X6RMA3_HYPEX|nr:hypothetical protein BV898_17292 [Hypsibius exemplaris]